MDEGDERRRRLEFSAKLERLAAERTTATESRSSAEQLPLNAKSASRGAENANKIAIISLVVVVIVTVVTIVGVIISIVGPHLGFSPSRAA